MPSQRSATRKAIATRMELMRRDNVKEHKRVVDKSQLKEQRVNAQRQREAQIGHDQLLGSMSSGRPLDKIRAARLEELANLIANKR